MADNPQPSLETERTCRKCGSTKPLADFAKVYSQNSRGQQYRQHTCLTCHREKSAEKERRRRAQMPDHCRAVNNRWRERNLAKAKATAKKAKLKLKREVLAAYGGERCKCCGETEITMLTIDHKDGNGSAHRKKVAKRKGYSPTTTVSMYGWFKKKGFPKGFQVLCYNCNISKHRTGKNICAHQLRGRLND